MRFARSLGLGCLLAGSIVACGFGDSDFGGAPDDNGPPGGPGVPPPTGGKWQGVVVEDACGRATIDWIVVDEVCGGTDHPAYLEYFRAPILRDGARLGDSLFTVDGTHLWVLDATTPNALERRTLKSGLGQPLAVAEHAGRLLLASGAEGLVVLDVTEPTAPSRVATVPLAGPALSVTVQADRAYVAMGAAGVAEVDLSGAPTLARVLEVPGFAASVAVEGDLAVVAACNTVVTVQLSTGSILGQAWLDEAVRPEDGVLIAPAKGVAIVGQTVFVAAGRYGAVAVDIANPANPSVRGNCTLANDMQFYASGVRAEAGRLFIAAGEWGVMPVDVSNPGVACSTHTTPIVLPPAGEQTGESCESQPPWEVLPWREAWLPPIEAGRDPLQTFPDGDVVYAFGDATRVGLRAVDVHLAADPAFSKIGRFDEPRLVTRIAARGNRVVVGGKHAGLYEQSGDSLTRLAALPQLAHAVEVGVLEDGRWVAAFAHPLRLEIEGSAPLAFGAPGDEVWPGTLAVGAAGRVVISHTAGVYEVDVDARSTVSLFSGRTAELPASVSITNYGAALASPEWTDSVILSSGSTTELDPHRIFGPEQVASAGEWRAGLPRRLLATNQAGLVEIATLGRKAGALLHGASTPPVPLPPGEYVGVVASGTRVHVVSIDRGLYRSQLLTLEAMSGAPVLTQVESWTGMATGIAAADGRVYVADADRGIRVYSEGVSPVLTAVIDVEAGAQ